MSTEQNKAIARRFIEVAVVHNLEALDEVVAPDCVFHDIEAFGAPPTLEGFKMLLSGFGPDVAADIEDTIELCFAEGDQVFIRHKASFTHAGEMMGVPATGKRVTTVEHNAFRIVDGKIRDQWVVPDMLGMMQQIGAIPAPE